MFLDLERNALRKTLSGAVLTLGFLVVASPSPAVEEGPFAGLAGPWSGGGVIALSDGSHERIRCRAHYSVGGGGRSLSQKLHCASESTRLDISSNVLDQGGALSGSWSEATHGASGAISGRVAGSTIRAQASGANFAAGIGINLRGDSQSVTITPSASSDIRSVSVSMRRD
jgi:hypothetical protein